MEPEQPVQPAMPPDQGKSFATAPKVEEMSIASLVCGIVSALLVFPGCMCSGYFFSWIPGIVAVVLGFYGRKKIKGDPKNFTGENLAIGGIITGIVGTAAALIFLILFLAMIIFEISLFKFLEPQSHM